MSLHRRRLLQSLSLSALPFVAGCTQSDPAPSADLRMFRIVNLSEQVVTVELTATRDSGTPELLYAGDVGTQEGDAGAGEVVLLPEAITDVFAYEYRLVVADGRKEWLTTDHLERGYRNHENSPSCVDLEFVVRESSDDAGVWPSARFWRTCETAPGTAFQSTDS